MWVDKVGKLLGISLRILIFSLFIFLLLSVLIGLVVGDLTDYYYYWPVLVAGVSILFSYIFIRVKFLSNKVKNIVVSIAALLIILGGAWVYILLFHGGVMNLVRYTFNMLLPQGIPVDYESCKKSFMQRKEINDLKCVWYSITEKQYEDCSDKTQGIRPPAVDDPPVKTCSLTYYNPGFVLPKNFEECVSKVGAFYLDPDQCVINIISGETEAGGLFGPIGPSDKGIAGKLFDECKNLPNSTIELKYLCRIVFEKGKY